MIVGLRSERVPCGTGARSISFHPRTASLMSFIATVPIARMVRSLRIAIVANVSSQAGAAVHATMMTAPRACASPLFASFRNISGDFAKRVARPH